MNELIVDLPIGLEVHKISWQSQLVNESIMAFLVSLAQAVAIVLVVLWIAMGFRTAMIVGFCGLVFVILMSFLVMYLWGIDLQRMSLGALVIAMGMMVETPSSSSTGSWFAFSKACLELPRPSRQRRCRLGRCWEPR